RRVGKGALAPCPPSVRGVVVNGGHASLCPPYDSGFEFQTANTVIARSAATKQSRVPPASGLLRFARNDGGHMSAFSRHVLPELLQIRCPSPKRGRRECRVRAAPAVSCAEIVHLGAHEHTGQRKHSDIPCAMALRLISRS